MNKYLLISLCALAVSGCATQGVVTIPVKPAVQNIAFQDKTIASEVFYSQPKPGIFSYGEILPLRPIKDAELSVGSSRVLSRFNEILSNQLPINSQVVSKDSDYLLTVELQAKDKLGPSYVDHDALLSFGKGIVTFGLGADEYTIIADFDVTYKLQNRDRELLMEETFSVYDTVDHESRGFIESNGGADLAQALLEKNMVITMNDFFTKLDKSEILN